MGLIAVLGLHASVARPAMTLADAEAAACIADAVRSRLRTLPHAAVVALIQTPDAVHRRDRDRNDSPDVQRQVLFGTRDGEIGISDPGSGTVGWRDSRGRVIADRDRFFEIDLIRNEELSPAEYDAYSACIAFHLRVRWPAIPGENSERPGKEVIFLAATISR